MSKPLFTYFVISLIACTVVLSSCSPQSLNTPEQDIPSSTRTLLPANDLVIPSPVPTLLPENTPVPSPTLIPWPAQPITQDNATEIQEINRWGRGSVQRIQKLHRSNDEFLVLTPLGVYLYQTTSPYLLAFILNADEFILSPDEHWLAVSMKNGNVEIWNMDEMSLEQTFTHSFPEDIIKKIEEDKLLPRYVGGMAFSYDSSQIAVGYLDGSVELWRIGESEPYSTLRHVSLLLTDADVYLAYNLQFSPDGKSLVVFKLPGIGSSNRMTFWSIPSGELITISRAGRFVDIAEFAFLPDGQILVVFMRDSSQLEIGFWDIATGNEISKFGTELSQIYKTEISSDGNQMVTYGMHVDGTYQKQVNKLPLGDFVEKEKLERFPLSAEQVIFEEFLFEQGHYSSVWGSEENPETAKIGVMGEESFRILGENNWLTFPEGISEPLNLPPDISNPYIDIQEQSIVWCESRVLYFQNKNGEIDTLDISAIPSCDGIAISREKHHISVWRDGSLYLIDSDTGKINNLILDEPMYRWSEIDGASFSPNEEFLFSVKSALVVWKVDPPQKLAMSNARGATGNVIKIVVSTDNSFVATLNAGTLIESDGTSNLTVWRVEDVAELMRISPPFVREVQPEFMTFALSPDDKLIVTGDDFGGVRLWSVETAEELAFFEFDYQPVDLAFTPNGSGLIIVLGDGTIRLWGVP